MIPPEIRHSFFLETFAAFTHGPPRILRKSRYNTVLLFFCAITQPARFLGGQLLKTTFYSRTFERKFKLKGPPVTASHHLASVSDSATSCVAIRQPGTIAHGGFPLPIPEQARFRRSLLLLVPYETNRGRRSFPLARPGRRGEPWAHRPPAKPHPAGRAAIRERAGLSGIRTAWK